jgi:hypothetical protein
MKGFVPLYPSTHTHTHTHTCFISILLSLNRQKFRLHCASPCGDLASVLSHEAGGIVDVRVLEASA